MKRLGRHRIALNELILSYESTHAGLYVVIVILAASKFGRCFYELSDDRNQGENRTGS